ncbi:DMT family transporter [Acuticoccus sp. MNP-M23]|uniref:DMT family transporter n=1 Tax=Acuticoccus sp. MNP-M23 TaxID=3072793 RepID=UPI002815099C|nr:DMT family transporter [Acuticoccus sp. MNP-M23]WMS44781.1 DMT family transporter [Acuticoccus sp. MNP-M23]
MARPLFPKDNDAVVGITYKIVSAMFFTAMLTIVKILGEGGMPVGEMLFSRNLFGVIPVAIMIAYNGHLREAMTTKKPFSHVRRAISGMLAMGLWFAALDRLSFPEATAIVYAAPLMMVVLAATFLGETVRIYRWSAVGIGFLGVFVILIPQFQSGFDVMADAKAMGALLALSSAVFMAFSTVFVRDLARTESTSTIVVYFLIAGTAITLVTAPTWIMPTWPEAIGLVMIGVLGGIGQLLVTQAFHHAEASLIAPFEYTSMLWVVAVGYFVFAEVPTWSVLIGATIVISSGIFVILRERRLGVERAERKLGAPLRS